MMTPPEDKKLTLVIRVEPGCLGPNGAEIVDDFCLQSYKDFEPLYSDFIHWRIEVRNDKILPEMDYYVVNKRLDANKAAQYLAVFEQNLAEIEATLEDKMATLINGYLDSQA